MNPFGEDDLHARIAGAKLSVLHPLHMQATCVDGTRHEALAINEVSLFARNRAGCQTQNFR